MTESRYIFQATQDNFAALVLDNSAKGPVLVYYWAHWAGPCHKFWPVLETLATDYGGKFLLISVDTDEQKPLAREQGINSIPTLKLFRHRKVVAELHGPQSEPDLRRLLDTHIVRLSDANLAAAIRQYQQGDVEQAVQLLREAERADPDNPRIPLILAKLLVRHGKLAEAEELLRLLPETGQQDPEISALIAHLGFIRVAEQAPPREELERELDVHPENAHARYQLSALKLVQDDYEGAMQQLLEIVRRDRTFDNDAGRRGLLAIFGMLGPDHALTRQYRSLMFNAIH